MVAMVIAQILPKNAAVIKDLFIFIRKKFPDDVLVRGSGSCSMSDALTYEIRLFRGNGG